jgi:predicted nucleotidyltransferase
MYLDIFIERIQGLCAEHKVRNLIAFGSVIRDDFKADSDIDLLVDINSADPIDYAENYFELKFKLQDLLKRPVDLLELKGLKNSYLIQNINRSKRTIYEN